VVLACQLNGLLASIPGFFVPAVSGPFGSPSAGRASAGGPPERPTSFSERFEDSSGPRCGRGPGPHPGKNLARCVPGARPSAPQGSAGSHKPRPCFGPTVTAVASGSGCPRVWTVAGPIVPFGDLDSGIRAKAPHRRGQRTAVTAPSPSSRASYVPRRSPRVDVSGVNSSFRPTAGEWGPETSKRPPRRPPVLRVAVVGFFRTVRRGRVLVARHAREWKLPRDLSSAGQGGQRQLPGFERPASRLQVLTRATAGPGPAPG